MIETVGMADKDIEKQLKILAEGGRDDLQEVVNYDRNIL